MNNPNDLEAQANDTVRVDLETGKIMDHVKFETGNLVMISPEDLVVSLGIPEMPHEGSMYVYIYI